MKKIYAATLALTILIAGCSSVYKQESQSSNPLEIAVLEHKSIGVDGFYISEVDGKWRGLGKISRFELAPGERKITIAYAGKDGRTSTGEWTSTFLAKKGKTYLLKGNVKGMNATVDIVDSETGDVVSKTTFK